jgi:hypothetical protein
MKRPGEELSTAKRCTGELDARAGALRALTGANVPFIVAGAYAFFEYTGIFRDTKDLDVFLRRRDLDAALDALERCGFTRQMEDPVWIAKAWKGEWFVDLIFSSGNGVAVVDDLWFAHAREAEVMGVPVLLAPPEEMIWSKGFVCERERYDGHDITNLIRARGAEMDWERLLARFGEHWEVLLSHLVMYAYAFPSERNAVPRWVRDELLRRSLAQLHEADAPERRACRGTLVSREQYRHVVEHLGYDDERGALREALLGREADDVDAVPAGGGR